MSIDDTPVMSARVRMHRGRPLLFINGRPEAPCFYSLTDVPGGRWSWEEHPRHNILAFANAGFRLFQLDIFLEQLWVAEDEIDITLLSKQIAGVREVVPDAAVMVRFHLNPPAWWIAGHPRELVAYDSAPSEPEQSVGLSRILEADPRNPMRASFASKVWRREVKTATGRVFRQLAKTPEAAALAAVQVANGVYGEWHYWGFMRWEPDVSPVMREYFHNRLIDIYEDEERLRTAWNDPNASFASAEIPDHAERSRTSGVFRDPSLHRRSIDYYMCQHELVAELIDEFCGVVKEAWPAPVATGAFYGYYFSVFNRQAAGGHLELSRLLESDRVDFLCGPQVYYPDDQGAGHPYRSRSLLGSVLLHGKLWLDEYDQEPPTTYPFLGGLTDNRERYGRKVDANLSFIRRGSLFAFLKGMGLWYYDFGPSGMHINRNGEYNGQLGTAGYWDNPEYMRDIAALKRVMDERSDTGYVSEADVLVVYDPRAHYYLKSVVSDPDPITPRAVDWLPLGLYYSGVVFDTIALPDLPLISLSSYRLVICANAYRISPDSASELRMRARDEGVSLLWIHAPGIIAADGLDFDRVSRVVELDLKPVSVEGVPECRYDAPYDLVDRLDGPCTPLFSPSDSSLRVLGRYNDTAFPALVSHDAGSGTEWYAGIPPTQPAILTEICLRSGVHRYAEDGDIVYAGGGLLTVHSRHGGVRLVRLRSGAAIPVDFGPGPGTVVLDSVTGGLVLN